MPLNKNGMLKRALLILCAANLTAFLFYYLANVIFENVGLLYISHFITDAHESIIPILILTVILAGCSDFGYKRSFLLAIPCALTYLIYRMPYAYISFFSTGYDMTDSLVLALISAFIMVIMLYAKVALLFLAVYIAGRLEKSRRSLKDILSENTSQPFDFSSRVTLCIFTSCSVIFLYGFIAEIIDTVRFMTEAIGTYRIGEIVYLVFSYIFLVIVLLASQIVAISFKKFISYSHKA